MYIFKYNFIILKLIFFLEIQYIHLIKFINYIIKMSVESF